MAKEIAARTVNKTHDISSSRRGGLRSHRGAHGRTKAQLGTRAEEFTFEEAPAARSADPGTSRWG